MVILIEKTEFWNADPRIVPILLILSHPIIGDKQEWLTRHIRSWYEVGYYGAFSGHILDISKITFTSDRVRWTVDFHGVPDTDAAIDTLRICLENFMAMHHVNIEKIMVGWVGET